MEIQGQIVASFFLMLLCTPSFASPPFPCVKAVTSSYGKFLVLTDAEMEQGQYRAKRVTLNILYKEPFANSRDSFKAAADYWIEASWWNVILTPKDGEAFSGCPVSLITDDSEFLIILNVSSNPRTALRIYRRRDHPDQLMGGKGPDHGVLVRDISLKEIWPDNKFREISNALITDSTPQWFAGGSFEFSKDNRTLIHKTRWGDVVTINLPDGTVAEK